MRVKSVFVTFLLCLAMIISATTAVAQKGLKYRSFVIDGVTDWDQRILDFVPIDKKTSVAFAHGRLKGSDFHRLLSVIFNKKGKILSVSDLDSFAPWVVPLWIDDGGNEHGLLFFGQNIGGTLFLKSVTFNSKGKFTSDPMILVEVPLTLGWGWDSSFLSGAYANGRAVAVFVTRSIKDRNFDDPSELRAFVVETDADGKKIGKNKSIILPAKISIFSTQAFTPRWSGKSWFIPSVAYHHENRTTQINLILAGKKANTKVRTLIPPDGSSYEWVNGTAQFLPAQSASIGTSAKTSGRLLYQSYRGLPAGSLLKFDFDTFLLSVKRNGKKSGAAIPVEIDDWQPEIKGDVVRTLAHREYLSDGILQDDGQLILAQVRDLRIELAAAPAADPIFIHQANILRINPENGKVTLLRRSEPSFNFLTWQPPLLKEQSGKFWQLLTYWNFVKKERVHLLAYF